MRRICFFHGAMGRSLHRTIMRLQPVYLTQGLCARLSHAARILPNKELVLNLSEKKCFREFSSCNRPANKLFLHTSQFYNIDRKYFKHTGSSSPSKDKDVRNFTSTVIDTASVEAGDKNNGDTQNVSEEWKEIRPNYNYKPYLSLAKIKLTSFVMMSSMAGYAAAPGAFDLTAFASCSLGVLLTSSAANAINQFFEVPYDSQMKRTMNRPLVKGLVTPLQAVTFAGLSATLGVTTMLCGANALTASLGLTTILLYTLVYTPMKRTNIANTWVGSVVGAIPPMMGWAAATGGLDAGAWLMGGVLFAWQFPHFNALSWNLQSDYSRAGYRMMSVVDPDLCKRVALRYSLGLTALSVLFPLCDVTSWAVAACMLPVNGYFNYLSWRFYKDGDGSSARNLFKFSLLYLPIVLGIIIVGKKRKSCQEECQSVE